MQEPFNTNANANANGKENHANGTTAEDFDIHLTELTRIGEAEVIEAPPHKVGYLSKYQDREVSGLSGSRWCVCACACV